MATPELPPHAASRRRLLLGLAAGAALAPLAGPALGASAPCNERAGRDERPRGCKAEAAPPRLEAGVLMAIGGNEDRRGAMAVLRRFVALSGGTRARIAVLTTASATPQLMGASYAQAFNKLGVRRRVELAIGSREDADSPAVARRILQADGVFITGGDQRRLLTALRGSAAQRALRRLHARPESCIAGTSAGAAALSRYMLVGDRSLEEPEQEAAWLEDGLSLLPGAIVDQHFSERHRLPRLVTAIAQQPHLLGLGVDEDTALVIEPGRAVEVVGSGTVTLLDGRHLEAVRPGATADAAATGQPLLVAGLRRHVISAGQRLALEGGAAGGESSDWVQQAVATLLRPPGAAPLGTRAAAQAATSARGEPRGGANWSVRAGPHLAHGPALPWHVGQPANPSATGRVLRRR